MLDPNTYLIDADLSRADLCVLHQLCVGKRVVEVGSGGSTLYLAQIAKSLLSFETDPRWYHDVCGQLDRRGHDPSIVQMLPSTGILPQLPSADVYFIDGVSRDRLRARWLWSVFEQRAASVALLHDSRRPHPTNEIPSQLFHWPNTAYLESVSFHHPDEQGRVSNMIVFRLRAKPVQYENWNHTESGRVAFGQGRPPGHCKPQRASR